MNSIVILFLSLGSLFILLAAVGSVKFPDTLTRMAAVCKASTLGSVLFCAAGIFHFLDFLVSLLLIAAAIFLFLGIPITSHLLSRVRLRGLHEAPLQTQRNDYEEDRAQIP